MTVEDDLLVAYVDGELDAVTAKRVERAVAEDAALAAKVAAHRRLRESLGAAFAPVAAEPVPDALRKMVPDNLVSLPRRRAWIAAAVSMAAALVLGVTVGQQYFAGPSPVMASGALAQALDHQPSGGQMLASFEDKQGRYCRIFRTASQDGIGCQQDHGWALVRTQAHGATASGTYQQAGSVDAALMAAAQDMMQGDPLSPERERDLLARGWQR